MEYQGSGKSLGRGLGVAGHVGAVDLLHDLGRVVSYLGLGAIILAAKIN